VRQGNLLDTSTALIALLRPDELSTKARNAIAAGPNYLSVVSYWQVIVKSMKGKLNVGDPRIWWADALVALVATPLILNPLHIAGIYRLEPIHKDPFDRVLIAQAIAEDLALVSGDSQIAHYANKKLKIIR
jgi:PIN domain nuclease of toxin-antitoxin system